MARLHIIGATHTAWSVVSKQAPSISQWSAQRIESLQHIPVREKWRSHFTSLFLWSFILDCTSWVLWDNQESWPYGSDYLKYKIIWNMLCYVICCIRNIILCGSTENDMFSPVLTVSWKQCWIFCFVLQVRLCCTRNIKRGGCMAECVVTAEEKWQRGISALCNITKGFDFWDLFVFKSNFWEAKQEREKKIQLFVSFCGAAKVEVEKSG